jgi:RNA polymerase sigma-70 factor (ECF subfamily)
MSDTLLAEIEELYRAEYRRFLRVAVGVLRDEERAVDAVQEAFATAVQKRRQFRGDGPLAAWIWRLVVNAALKERAKSRPLRLVEGEAGAESEVPVAIAEAVARLPERQRLMLFLRYYADLEYEAIAAALDVSPGTVGATLNAAHASLRRTLQEVQP